MAADRFVLLAIDSNDAGVRVLLRCTSCGDLSGFQFEGAPWWGRYPLLCGCGAEAALELRRPTPESGLVRELRNSFAWAPVIERRLIPKLN